MRTRTMLGRMRSTLILLLPRKVDCLASTMKGSKRYIYPSLAACLIVTKKIDSSTHYPGTKAHDAAYYVFLWKGVSSAFKIAITYGTNAPARDTSLQIQTKANGKELSYYNATKPP